MKLGRTVLPITNLFIVLFWRVHCIKAFLWYVSDASSMCLALKLPAPCYGNSSSNRVRRVARITSVQAKYSWNHFILTGLCTLH